MYRLVLSIATQFSSGVCKQALVASETCGRVALAAVAWFAGLIRLFGSMRWVSVLGNCSLRLFNRALVHKEI